MGKKRSKLDKLKKSDENSTFKKKQDQGNPNTIEINN